MENFLFFKYLGVGFIIIAVIIFLIVFSAFKSHSVGDFFFSILFGILVLLLGTLFYVGFIGRFDSGYDARQSSSVPIGPLSGSPEYYLSASYLYSNGGMTYTYFDLSSGKEVILSDGYDVQVQQDDASSPSLTVYEIEPVCDPHSEMEKWFGVCFGGSHLYVFNIPAGSLFLTFDSLGPNNLLTSQ